MQTYCGDRVIYDADAHAIELPNYMDEYLPSRLKDQFYSSIDPYDIVGRELDPEEIVSRQSDPQLRARDSEEFMLRKMFDAIGGVIPADRRTALDLLGVQMQVVTTTTGLRVLRRMESLDDAELITAVVEAHNRFIIDFCSTDPRLLPVCYVPLRFGDRVGAFAAQALEMGAGALMIPSQCPKDHSPSHLAHDPLWSAAQEAEVPVVFHVGGQEPSDPNYGNTGRAEVQDFLGGDDSFNSVAFMSVPFSAMQTLSALILDNVLENYPRLRIGALELGAAWLPSLMDRLDATAEAFHAEERVQSLSLRPSEYIRRQVRATPYPNEDVGQLISLMGPDICMFSTDYPHIEGGRDPLKRFDQSLAGTSEQEKEKFFSANFTDTFRGALKQLA